MFFSQFFLKFTLWIIAFHLQFSLIAGEMPDDYENLEPMEGDMILTKRQKNYVYGPLQSRKAINNQDYYWPKGIIFYRINSSVENITDTIMKAIEHWEENTCIKFHKLSEEVNIPHVIFTNGTGCSSIIGRQWWNTVGQAIYIESNCNIMGKVAHEIGHAIGFFHEQSRPDRDRYVKVLEENIDPSMMANFLMRNNIDLDKYAVPYDLSSVMHYSTKAFSLNGKNTLAPTNPMNYYLLGQRKGLSFFDMKLANLMYNCSDDCHYIPNCINNGYVDKSCTCRCPKGFYGEYCQNVNPIPDQKCGSIINESSTILSPNYLQKSNSTSRCVWWMKAPNNTVIKAVFHDFQLVPRNSIGFCIAVSFELRLEDIFDGDTFCGNELDGKTLVSTSNNMVFTYYSQKNVTQRGFNITVEFMENYTT